MGICGFFNFVGGALAAFKEFGQEGRGIGLCAAAVTVQQIAGRSSEDSSPCDALSCEVVFGEWGLIEGIFDTAARGPDIRGDAYEAALVPIFVR